MDNDDTLSFVPLSGRYEDGETHNCGGADVVKHRYTFGVKA
jgi:hypothetical protein